MTEMPSRSVSRKRIYEFKAGDRNRRKIKPANDESQSSSQPSIEDGTDVRQTEWFQRKDWPRQMNKPEEEKKEEHGEQEEYWNARKLWEKTTNGQDKGWTNELDNDHSKDEMGWCKKWV